jgi:hypothetical protein
MFGTNLEYRFYSSAMNSHEIERQWLIRYVIWVSLIQLLTTSNGCHRWLYAVKIESTKLKDSFRSRR